MRYNYYFQNKCLKVFLYQLSVLYCTIIKKQIMNKYNKITLEALKYYHNVLVANNEVHQLEDVETLSKIINHLKN